MNKHLRPYIISSIWAILLLWSNSLCLHAQSSEPTWFQEYQNYIDKDHKGNIDSLTSYSWKAFYIARRQGSDSLQLRALGHLVNSIDIDSLYGYIQILDTFPKSTYQVYQRGQMQLSYYRTLMPDMTHDERHHFVDEMILKADSVYADSLGVRKNRDTYIQYLITNRLYLSALIQAVNLDSTESPFYEYLNRFNDIVMELPPEYTKAKLNSFMTSSALYLQMKECIRALTYSEVVIEGIRSIPGVPNDFQEMDMSHASLCYIMCYQQLQCYDFISDEQLERNWNFIHSPYGYKCRDFIHAYGEGEITPSIYYNMGQKKFWSVIQETEKKIQQYPQDKAQQMVFVNLQNKAISRIKASELFVEKMQRNYALKTDYQKQLHKEQEIDYASLFAINKLKNENAQKQLEEENQKVFWSISLFFGIMVIIVFSVWGVRILHKSNKRKNELIRELQDATTKTTREKKQAERAKMIHTTCLDNMNHEIRSPLNSIVGFSELLLEDPNLDAETKAQFANQIDTSSAMLLQIINDVLDAAQLESGHYKLQKENLGVCQLGDYAIRSLQHKVHPGVVMTLDCQLTSCVEVYTDKTRLLQILFNFLSNACKHTSEGHIILSCDWADEHKTHVLFAVTDTGRGVPADKQPYLFERFAKLNHKAQGTGLGLNIAATLAHVMEAEIGYDSSYTDGARFYLKMPKG